MGGGGGHLERVVETPEEAEANARQIEEARSNWVKAADRVLQESTDMDERRDLGNFAAGMNTARGHPRGFREHDRWLDDLPPELRKKVEDALSGTRR
jgi:hypothetical protein